ncbi:MAG: GNAT family N-acetyltransferase [Candidatus Bipolaricaulota bacterium]|nr:GNAT family N-acetyltransferase [Candidatus Bipolaricaulota bacterium]
MYAHREITDAKQVLDLVRYAHSIRNPEISGVGEYLASDLAEGRRLFGVTAADRLVACWLLHPFRMRLRRSLVSMGGIGLVGSRPDVRGQGSVRFLLEKSLETMREAGHAVSVLYPFSQSFYRKYGWELFTQSRRYELALGGIQIPDDGSTSLDAIELSYPDEASKAFYNAYAAEHYTFAQRGDPEWRKALHLWPDHIARGAVKIVDGETVVGLLGYTLYRRPDKEAATLNVHLFAHSSEEAKRAMLRYLKRQSHQNPTAELHVPMDEVLWPYLADSPTQHRIHDEAMIRVVDLECLDRLELDAPDTQLDVEVADPQAPWNAGVWSLRVRDGRLGVARGSKALLRCGIGALSSVLSGFASCGELIAARRIEALPGYDGADLPKVTTLLADGF